MKTMAALATISAMLAAPQITQTSWANLATFASNASDGSVKNLELASFESCPMALKLLSKNEIILEDKLPVSKLALFPQC